ncbi:carbohydrate ABC transporter permease [Georgenia faecalis]|uniref:Carbohydrate ABC transporter permease n=1 Tax=Georgenia faecalis TaxID=2483799 RepID=A0ABV9D8E1_9MICO|nr:carbohydrate ABC transporter permease [Georgenia faecalis]
MTTDTALSAPAAAAASPHPAPRRRRGRRNRQLGGYVFLWAYSLIAMSPLLFLVVSSVRPSIEIFTDPLGLPSVVSVENYRRAWIDGGFSTYFVNSVLVTLGGVALGTVTSLLAAYPLARWRLRGGEVLSSYFLTGLLLPAQMGILPMFYLLQSLDLFDSRLGLVLVYAATGVPFGVFVMTTFFRQVPLELEEAADLDGAGPLRTFWQVMVPLVTPAISTVVIFQFVPLWNDLFYPLILLRSDENFTIPVGISRFFGQYQADWGTLMAGLFIATVPIILMFVVATRRVISALTAGIGK